MRIYSVMLSAVALLLLTLLYTQAAQNRAQDAEVTETTGLRLEEIRIERVFGASKKLNRASMDFMLLITCAENPIVDSSREGLMVRFLELAPVKDSVGTMLFPVKEDSVGDIVGKEIIVRGLRGSPSSHGEVTLRLSAPARSALVVPLFKGKVEVRKTDKYKLRFNSVLRLRGQALKDHKLADAGVTVVPIVESSVDAGVTTSLLRLQVTGAHNRLTRWRWVFGTRGWLGGNRSEDKSQIAKGVEYRQKLIAPLGNDVDLEVLIQIPRDYKEVRDFELTNIRLP